MCHKLRVVCTCVAYFTVRIVGVRLNMSVALFYVIRANIKIHAGTAKVLMILFPLSLRLNPCECKAFVHTHVLSLSYHFILNNQMVSQVGNKVSATPPKDQAPG